MRRENDNIVSKCYKAYNHTSDDYTVTAIDKETDYNKRLRLEEAWILLFESTHPKGLNRRMQVLQSRSLKETTPNYKAELKWHNLETPPQLLYTYQLNVNHLLGDADTKTVKSLLQNHCIISIKYGKIEHINR